MELIILKIINAFSTLIFLIFLVLVLFYLVFLLISFWFKNITSYERLLQKSTMQKVKIPYSPKPQKHIFLTFISWQWTLPSYKRPNFATEESCSLLKLKKKKNCNSCIVLSKLFHFPKFQYPWVQNEEGFRMESSYLETSQQLDNVFKASDPSIG